MTNDNDNRSARDTAEMAVFACWDDLSTAVLSLADVENDPQIEALNDDWDTSYPEQETAQILTWGLLLGVAPARHETRLVGDRLLPCPRFWHPGTLTCDRQTETWQVGWYFQITGTCNAFHEVLIERGGGGGGSGPLFKIFFANPAMTSCDLDLTTSNTLSGDGSLIAGSTAHYDAGSGGSIDLDPCSSP